MFVCFWREVTFKNITVLELIFPKDMVWREEVRMLSLTAALEKAASSSYQLVDSVLKPFFANRFYCLMLRSIVLSLIHI